jgi:hypothetical protein
MREIKVRAWDKRREKMISPNDGDFIGWHAMSNWRDCLEVMQYTGLHDKAGVEIYEGDIVRVVHDDRYAPGIGVVEWNESSACFEFGLGTASEVNWSHEVIGNIYENPDLLEV